MNKQTTRNTYSEDEYVEFYLSKNLVEPWYEEEFSDVLREKYKSIRRFENVIAEEGETPIDFIKEEIDNAPISKVFVSYPFFFGYEPKKRRIECLNDSIAISDVPEGQESNAIALAYILYSSYGSISGSYEALLKEAKGLH